MCKRGDESSLNIRSAAQCIVTGSQCHGHSWIKVLEQLKPATKLRIISLPSIPYYGKHSGQHTKDQANTSRPLYRWKRTSSNLALPATKLSILSLPSIPYYGKHSGQHTKDQANTSRPLYRWKRASSCLALSVKL